MFKVQRRAAKLLHSAKMPARMEMLQKQKKQHAAAAGKGGGKGGGGGGHGNEENFKMKLNKISSMEGSDIKKYFEKSQIKFKKSLQQAKQSRTFYFNFTIHLLLLKSCLYMY